MLESKAVAVEIALWRVITKVSVQNEMLATPVSKPKQKEHVKVTMMGTPQIK
jgi:hypothetical protein